MSFCKNLFVFVSGAVVGAGALAGFVGWQAYKALKKNDILYTAVRSSVDAGVKAASSEFSEHGAKAIVNMVFGKRKGHKITYDNYYYAKNRRSHGCNIGQVYFDNRKDAENVLSCLADIIERHGKATVSDFFDAAGANEISYSSSLYGWTDLSDACAVKVRRGWIVSFPDPIKLE